MKKDPKHECSFATCRNGCIGLFIPDEEYKMKNQEQEENCKECPCPLYSEKNILCRCPCHKSSPQEEKDCQCWNCLKKLSRAEVKDHLCPSPHIAKEEEDWEKEFEKYHYRFRNNFGYQEVEFFISQLLVKEKEAERERILNSLPRKFWEDEDHAVGGYISKKDLKELLTQKHD